MSPPHILGRFAPSPTGPLHAGSLVAALASWLDAKAQHGQWGVRMEDVDTTRCLPGMAELILQQLAACGLHSDLPVWHQSARSTAYQTALTSLTERQLAYPCACSRSDIAQALRHIGQAKPRHGELVYPGTCRQGLHGKPARAWRLRTDVDMSNWPVALINKAQAAMLNEVSNACVMTPNSSSLAPLGTLGTLPPLAAVQWLDRRLGWQSQDVAHEVGDFILKRADGCFAYQLAVVVDDAAQGITDVVRGADLADNTARQIMLQRALGLPTPRYLHTPLVLGPDGHKLSKQNGAQALNTTHPLAALNAAARVLGLAAASGAVADALGQWVTQWRGQWL
ncbi:tRNA glutamyl-Q(34) synthetase GluQRS [Rhodoferax sp.]|uniref:tRNA glutamyl-Q(34) synthetase GluQRS n=1 Tax=Rhodoferax sp. TaxID=50421 RepID=UPI002627C7C9|nr:tRNA glutamyl-Q(34) synthetase GluQRS [Rhodoferax sp.]MDD2808080.1 tRNA glutamyl-Q(34) synthetase GluQRS [Rhodoferax sp.]MDD4944438.1 tRNA glutamyl-Q(34) synthetase GluQRS [Rhodoferax sp.]